MIAVDFSVARPEPSALAEAGAVRAFIYLGWSRPDAAYLDDLRAHGVGIGFIFESTTTRAFDGYQAGRTDGAYSATRLGVALPDDPVVWTCDTPNITGHENAVAEYARGFRDGLGWIPDLGYGPQAAKQAAGENVLDWWGVEVWTGGGYGIPPGRGSTSTNDPNHLAKNVEVWRGIGAAMVQAFGPGPVDGTDLNIVLDPAAIGVGPQPQEDDDVYYLRCDDTKEILAVSEFRVAGYPLGGAPAAVLALAIACTGAEREAEIAARNQLLTDLSPKADGSPSEPIDLAPLREGLEAAKAGADATSAGLTQALDALP